jgi:hypothetical protein
MKKLLIALAVVASIGVTLSENNVVSTTPQYVDLLRSGYDEESAANEAFGMYYGGCIGVHEIYAQ